MFDIALRSSESDWQERDLLTGCCEYPEDKTSESEAFVGHGTTLPMRKGHVAAKRAQSSTKQMPKGNTLGHEHPPSLSQRAQALGAFLVG